jgi:flagellar hook-length control protein FliK
VRKIVGLNNQIKLPMQSETAFLYDRTASEPSAGSFFMFLEKCICQTGSDRLSAGNSSGNNQLHTGRKPAYISQNRSGITAAGNRKESNHAGIGDNLATKAELSATDRDYLAGNHRNNAVEQAKGTGLTTGFSRGSNEDKTVKDTADNEAPLHNAENLQMLIDKTMAMLQNLPVEQDYLNQIGYEDPSSKDGIITAIVSVKQEIERILPAIEEMAGKDSEAVKFAMKLLDLLGDEHLERIIQSGIKISAESDDDLHALVARMLNESEGVRINMADDTDEPVAVAERDLCPVINAGEKVNEKTVPLAEDVTPSLYTVSESSDDEAQSEQQKAFLNNTGELFSGKTGKESGQENLKATIKSPAINGRQGDTAEYAPGNTANPEFVNGIKGFQASDINVNKESAHTIPATKVVEQIIEKAQTLSADNKSEMVMVLKPESLGKISLKVIHERGEIVARFVAETEQVKSILESNMQLLKDSLQKSGFTITSLSVSVGGQGQGQGANPQTGQNGEMISERLILADRMKNETAHRLYQFSGLTDDPFHGAEHEINLTA